MACYYCTNGDDCYVSNTKVDSYWNVMNEGDAMNKYVHIQLTDGKFEFSGAHFSSCKNSTFDTSNWYIDNEKYKYSMARMFSGCTYLTSIDLSRFDFSKATSFEGMFEGCTRLESPIEINAPTLKWEDVSLSEMFYNCSALSTIKLNFNPKQNSIGSMYRTFANCKKLNNLTLVLGEIHPTYLTETFSHCEVLGPWLDLRDFYSERCTGFGGTFANCYNLELLNLYNITDVSNSLGFTDMFYDDRKLSTVIIAPNTRWRVPHANRTIDADMFKNCTSLPGYPLYAATVLNYNLDRANSILPGVIGYFRGGPYDPRIPELVNAIYYKNNGQWVQVDNVLLKEDNSWTTQDLYS